MDSASDGGLLQAHLRELDADVGVEAALGDGVEQDVVDVGGAVRFGWRGDAFAERVKGDGDALAVDGFGDAQRVFGLHAGDESRIEASAQRGVLSESAKRAVMRERNKGGTKKMHNSSLLTSALAGAHLADEFSFAHGIREKRGD